MIVALVVGLLAVLFSWIARHARFQYCLAFAFLLVFLFLALRYDYGNDYGAYLNGFLEINGYSGFSITEDILGYEMGWKLLCRMFHPIGFFGMTAVIALFNSFVYFRFIKRHVPAQYYWLGTFIYVFSSGLMLTHLSAMRQSLAINIFIYATEFIYEKKAVRYLMCIILASLIHTSALILFPLYIFGYYNPRVRIKSGAIIITVFSLLFVFGKVIAPKITVFVSNRIQRYSVYEQAGAGELTTGLGLVFLSVILILSVATERYQHRKDAIPYKLLIINSMFIPLGLAYMMFGRLAMYFAPAAIAVYPLNALPLKNVFIRYSYILLIIVFIAVGFFRFFQSPIWHDSYESYKTIFTAPEFY